MINIYSILQIMDINFPLNPCPYFYNYFHYYYYFKSVIIPINLDKFYHFQRIILIDIYRKINFATIL